MTSNQNTIGALAMDLKRVAIGYHRGSELAAERFSREALKRRGEIETATLKPYLKTLIANLPKILNQKNKSKLADDTLLYSILFQNYALVNE